jgi:hypothetical protein
VPSSATHRRRRLEPVAGAERRPALPYVARECWIVAGIAVAIVVGILIAIGANGPNGFYSHSDAPLFLHVALSPFGNGHNFPGNPLVHGVEYRYGRILFPLTGWLLALGQPFAVKWTLAAVYVASFGAWVALAGEHLRRGGRSPRLALWIFATPWALLWFVIPDIVSEPMAGALLLLAYLYEREGRHKSARITAVFAILTRELMIVAFIPLAWRAWKERRWAGVRDWVLVVMPYVAWTVWVRFRIGQFPFLDPSTSRREALAPPLVGWYRTMAGPLDNGQGWAVLIGAATFLLVVLVAFRGNWLYPVTHGAVALALLSLCYGLEVFAFPGEGIRVMAPTQMLLLIAACASGGVNTLTPASRVRTPRRAARAG